MWLLTSNAITKAPVESIATAGFCSLPASAVLAPSSVASIAPPLAEKRRKKMPALSPEPCPCHATTKAPVLRFMPMTELAWAPVVVVFTAISPVSAVPLAAKRRA